jgi:hypothetical protein
MAGSIARQQEQIDALTVVAALREIGTSREKNERRATHLRQIHFVIAVWSVKSQNRFL